MDKGTVVAPAPEHALFALDGKCEADFSYDFSYDCLRYILLRQNGAKALREEHAVYSTCLFLFCSVFSSSITILSLGPRAHWWALGPVLSVSWWVSSQMMIKWWNRMAEEISVKLRNSKTVINVIEIGAEFNSSLYTLTLHNFFIPPEETTQY